MYFLEIKKLGRERSNLPFVVKFKCVSQPVRQRRTCLAKGKTITDFFPTIVLNQPHIPGHNIVFSQYCGKSKMWEKLRRGRKLSGKLAPGCETTGSSKKLFAHKHCFPRNVFWEHFSGHDVNIWPKKATPICLKYIFFSQEIFSE